MAINTEVRLSWSEQNNNISTGYEIHRSTSPNFTPSSETKIADVSSSTNNFDDEVPDGTYYYKVVVYNPYGSSTSGEVEVIAFCNAGTTAIVAVAYAE